MARDPLVDSVDTDVAGIRVWIKRYESGRTRVLLPAGFEVKAIVNGGNTDDLKIELVPNAG